jgi:predicted component of type VI protein secretion system
MLKRMLFATAVTGLLAGAALPIHATSAVAAPSGCHKAAKAKFPGIGQHRARHEYRKWCKAHWKAYKASQKA